MQIVHWLIHVYHSACSDEANQLSIWFPYINYSDIRQKCYMLFFLELYHNCRKDKNNIIQITSSSLCSTCSTVSRRTTSTSVPIFIICKSTKVMNCMLCPTNYLHLSGAFWRSTKKPHTLNHNKLVRLDFLNQNNKYVVFLSVLENNQKRAL